MGVIVTAFIRRQWQQAYNSFETGDDSTDEKAKVYDQSDNTIVFKIDIRCIHDQHNREIDLCSMEMSLPETNKDGVLGIY